MSSRGQDRRGQRWRWEERSFQEPPVRPQPGGMSPAEATPVTGFAPIHCWWEQREEGAAEGGSSAKGCDAAARGEGCCKERIRGA